MGFFAGKDPKLKTYSTIAGWQTELGKSMAEILGGMAPEALGRIFEREDPFSIVKDWRETFATPVMRMWQRDILPMIKEGFNMFPGSFYSKSRFTGMQREAEEFYGGKVAPLLFSALEGARGRGLQRQSLMASLLGFPTQLAAAPTIGGAVVGGAPSQFSQLWGTLSGVGSDIAAGLDWLGG